MSTRAYIGVRYGYEKIEYVSCHRDGNPEIMGRTLLDHYNSFEKAKELVSHGNMSDLGETIDECKFHKYVTFLKNCYNEWDDIKPRIQYCYKLENIQHDIEFVYIYNQVFERWEFQDTSCNDLRKYLKASK